MRQFIGTAATAVVGASLWLVCLSTESFLGLAVVAATALALFGIVLRRGVTAVRRNGSAPA